MTDEHVKLECLRIALDMNKIRSNLCEDLLVSAAERLYSFVKPSGIPAVKPDKPGSYQSDNTVSTNSAPEKKTVKPAVG